MEFENDYSSKTYIRVANKHERLNFERIIQSDLNKIPNINENLYGKQQYTPSVYNNQFNNQHSKEQIYQESNSQQQYSQPTRPMQQNNFQQKEKLNPNAYSNRGDEISYLPNVNQLQLTKRDINWEQQKTRVTNIASATTLSEDFSHKEKIPLKKLQFEIVDKSNGIRTDRQSPVTGNHLLNTLNNNLNVNNNIYSGAPNERLKKTPFENGNGKYYSSDQVHIYNNSTAPQRSNDSYNNKKKEVDIKPYSNYNQVVTPVYNNQQYNEVNNRQSGRSTPFERVNSFTPQVNNFKQPSPYINQNSNPQSNRMTPNQINYNTYIPQNSNTNTPSYNNQLNNQAYNKPFNRDTFQYEKRTPNNMNYNQVY